MGGFTVGVLLLLLTISASASSVQVGDSPVTCSDEGVECDRTGDNLIDAVTHVMTIQECRQICLDDNNCSFISYFDDSASPIPHFCQLFTSCETINNCTNCMSENMGCYRSCGSNIVGVLEDNVQDVIPNIDSELECRMSCLSSFGCTFYTYVLLP